MSKKRRVEEIRDLIRELYPYDIRTKTLTSSQKESEQSRFAQFIADRSEKLRNEENAQKREIEKNFFSMYEFFYETCEKEYLAGDSKALMKCIDFCCINKTFIPDWAAKAFHEGYTKVRNYEARGWDDVFGKPNKGKHLKEQRRDEDKQQIYKSVSLLRDQGQPIDAGLFETVGPRFGSKGREIGDIYYELEHRLEEKLQSHRKGCEITHSAMKKLRQNKTKK